MPELTDALQREIGQHFVVGFLGYDVSEDSNIAKLIRDHYVGNVIIMKRNVRDIHQVRRLTSTLQRIAKEAGHARPLMIGIDQENGLVAAFSTAAADGGTHFPGAMAQAAIGSPDTTEAISAACAKEMKLAGINWVYSPVADINSDSRNPVIGVRSYGDDPAQVARYVTAASRGLTSQGIAPSPKHFPGHGDTHVDSHLGLPTIDKPLSTLLDTELVPFIELIKVDTATIMTGHMALPQLNPTKDRDLPASLSREVSFDLLRTRLGFEGVVVTDCLEMDAVAKRPRGVEKGAVDAIQAGADIVMICHTYAWHKGAVEATWAAVESGELDVSELEASGKRIGKLKDQFNGSWDEVINGNVFIDSERLGALKTEHTKLALDAYARSTTLIRDPGHVLPSFKPTSLAPSKRFLIFSPVMEVLNRAVDDAENIIRTKDGKVRNTAGPSYESFFQAIKSRVPGSQHVVASRSQSDEGLLEDVKALLTDPETAGIIYLTRNADQTASSWQVAYLRRVLAALPESTPVVLLATCGPYDFLAPAAAASLRELGEEKEKERSVAYLASYEFTVAALETAAKVILGEIEPVGVCPVRSE